MSAARELALSTLAIQRVADHLGVDRKAVTYHVPSRDTLLELLAVDAFTTNFEVGEIPAAASWDEALRIIARSMRDTLIRSGNLLPYFSFDGRANTAVLRAAETVLEKMVGAGFDERTAAQAMALVANAVVGHARDVVVNAREGGHPQQVQLSDALEASDESSFGVLRRINAAGYGPYSAAEDQFEFILDVVIRGLAERLISCGD